VSSFVVLKVFKIPSTSLVDIHSSEAVHEEIKRLRHLSIWEENNKGDTDGRNLGAKQLTVSKSSRGLPFLAIRWSRLDTS